MRIFYFFGKFRTQMMSTDNDNPRFYGQVKIKCSKNWDTIITPLRRLAQWEECFITYQKTSDYNMILIIIYRSTTKFTPKFAIETLKILMVLATSLRLGFCDQWKRAFRFVANIRRHFNCALCWMECHQIYITYKIPWYT